MSFVCNLMTLIEINHYKYFYLSEYSRSMCLDVHDDDQWPVQRSNREFVLFAKICVFILNSFLMVWSDSGHLKVLTSFLSNVFFCDMNFRRASANWCTHLAFNICFCILHCLPISDIVNIFIK